MGQNEVLNYLQEERIKSDKWLETKVIKEALKTKGMGNGALQGVYSDLLRLCLFNAVEVKGEGIWEHKKLFRAVK